MLATLFRRGVLIFLLKYKKAIWLQLVLPRQYPKVKL